MLPASHILASVSNVYNAVLLEGDAVGQILLYGKGAGEMPTASAVFSDINDAASDIMSKTAARIPMNYYSASRSAALTPARAALSGKPLTHLRPADLSAGM